MAESDKPKTDREDSGIDEDQPQVPEVIPERWVPAVPTEKSIQLAGDSTKSLDVTGLTEEQIQELKVKHADLAIETEDYAKRVAIDAKKMDLKLGAMSSRTKEVAGSGQDITITNVEEDLLGRTETVMGTSETAKKGKLTRSQKGLKDPTTLTLGFALIVIIIVATLLVKLFG